MHFLRKQGVVVAPIIRNRNIMNCSGVRQHKVAVTQVTSTDDKEENYGHCQRLIKEASLKGCSMVFLPEAFDFICASRKDTISNAESIEGDLIDRYKALAKVHKIWISLGGFHERVSEDTQDKLFNSHIVINSSGGIDSIYRKLHLFDVELETVRLKESDYVEGGKSLLTPVATPVGKLGLLVCYDLRFPECSLLLAQMGAEILTFPSSFTQPTGKAHWEVLLRARAVENQCYVIAAAQYGQHNQSRSSFGHAMIVDPWGQVIAKCEPGDSLQTASIDLDYIAKVREQLPVSSHKRYDVYQPVSLQPVYSLPEDEDCLQFGQVNIKGKTVFLMSQHSMAFVNKRCILPGHVLVSSRRVVKRVAGLSQVEVSDLFLMVQKVQSLMEKVHCTTSSTIAIQDGKAAGQSIQHVHVHIVPRKENDLKNCDDIYGMLERHDKIDLADRKEEEMESEACLLRDSLASFDQK